jgi:hypothetical protein
MLLGVILVVLVGLYWWSGDKELRSAGWSIATALAVASVIAIVVYYGHFAEAYRSAARVSTAGEQTIYASLSAKAFDVARLTVQGLGWPLFLLGLVGAVHLWTTSKRDRLTRMVATLGISLVALGIAVTVTPVEQSFQRYNAEFFQSRDSGHLPGVCDRRRTRKHGVVAPRRRVARRRRRRVVSGRLGRLAHVDNVAGMSAARTQ